MIGPISNLPQAPIQPTRKVRRRKAEETAEVEVDAVFESNDTSHAVHLRRTSQKGALIYGSMPKLDNDMFIELHIEGQDSVKASVVGEIPGGYQIKFNDGSPPAGQRLSKLIDDKPDDK